MNILSDIKSFEGRQLRLEHYSTVCQCVMTFSLYLPPAAQKTRVPLLTFLSGLTCNDENFTHKSAAQKYASEYNIALLMPDTSPRGTDVATSTNNRWDLGLGAGFYINATQMPWKKNYQMYSYITHELPELIKADEFNINIEKQSISGHSMGGHGALMIALKNPRSYRSVSAFAPICSPTQCQWGKDAFEAYLGQNYCDWTEYDSCELVKKYGSRIPILIDQGTDDPFLHDQLMPYRLKEACHEMGVELNIRMQKGYDHSYFFIATFIEEHIAYHAQKLYTSTEY